eukprot:403345460
MEKKIQSLKPQQRVIGGPNGASRRTNQAKYNLEQHECSNANDDDEGNLNNFQIYDALQKQITDGTQLMPGSTSSVVIVQSTRESQISNKSSNSRSPPTLSAKIKAKELNQQIPPKQISNASNRKLGQEQQNSSIGHIERSIINPSTLIKLNKNHAEDEQFFDHTYERGKKRSLTDDKMFQNNQTVENDEIDKTPNELFSQINSKELGGSTNDTSSNQGQSKNLFQRPYRIKSNNYSDVNSDDYLEKKEPINMVSNQQYHQPQQFVIADYQDSEFQNNDAIQTPSSSTQKQKSPENKDKEGQASYYQYWVNKGINYKYKMPWSTLAKVFTEYQQVTFEPKDLPLILLDKLWEDTNLGKNFQKQKNFLPLLTENKYISDSVMQKRPNENFNKVFTTTDVGWGCTIRVGQMMICQALMRHLIGLDHSVKNLSSTEQKRLNYAKIIQLIHDNDCSQTGAFSIQNIAKMGFCHDKLPGEWYGPHALTIMLRDLNRIYQPVENFQVCMFRDGNVYYDKIMKTAITDGKAYQIKKKGKPMSMDQCETINRMQTQFHKFLIDIGYYNDFPLSRYQHHDKNKEFDSPKLHDRDSDSSLQERLDMIYQDPEILRSAWRNGILVIIPTRLGLNKVNKEYYSSIKYVFQCRLNVGIMGGRPNQALYFVGTQKTDLICLDPHLVQDTVLNQEELSNVELNQTYHCDQAKKLSMTKLDTSLAFGFYLKDYNDFEVFQGFIEMGQKLFKENWVFSIFNRKPDYGRFSERASDNFYLPKTTLGFDHVTNYTKKGNSNISQNTTMLTINPIPLNKNRSTNVPQSRGIELEEDKDDDFELI